MKIPYFPRSTELLSDIIVRILYMLEWKCIFSKNRFRTLLRGFFCLPINIRPIIKKKKIPPRLTVIGDEKILSRIMLKDKRKNSHIHIMIIGN